MKKIVEIKKTIYYKCKYCKSYWKKKKSAVWCEKDCKKQQK